MASARCECTYRAKTRCELYALAVDELYGICSEMELEHVDDMARSIYADYAKRKMQRSLALRFIFSAKRASMHQGNDWKQEEVVLLAALRLQARWLRSKAFECSKSKSYRTLLPALYTPTNEFRGGAQGTNQVLDHQATGKPHSPSPEHQFSREVAESVAVLDTELSELRKQNAAFQAQLAKVEQRIAELPTLKELSEVINQAVRDAVVGVDVEARVASL